MRIEPETYSPSARPTGKRLAALALAVAAAAVLASCGGGRDRETRVPGGTLTVYSSLPRHGVAARVANAVAAGEQLALADAHGRVGGRRVRLVELDDSDPTGEIWAPPAVEENARRAVADPTTIAYIGELSLGGSAISVPVTNDARILQLSPADGLTSLTRRDPGATGASGPERYYPSDRRTFLRLVPTDAAQAATLVSWIAAQGGHRVAFVQDETLFGRELGGEGAALAGRAQLAVTDVVEAKDDPTAYPGLALALAQKQPDSIVYTGIGGANAAPLLDAIHQALPRARLYGSSGLAAAAPPPATLPATVDVLNPALPPAHYPPAGRRVLARLESELGVPIAVEALNGYEAMEIVLDAIRRAGKRGNDRVAVAAAALTPRRRSGVLGTYALTATGDVSPVDFAAYAMSDAGLAFQGIHAPGATLPPPRGSGT
jgi:branched-chain amino acid transport system substrate-binding protein